MRGRGPGCLLRHPTVPRDPVAAKTAPISWTGSASTTPSLDSAGLQEVATELAHAIADYGRVLAGELDPKDDAR